jgi:SET domain-containing protein
MYDTYLKKDKSKTGEGLFTITNIPANVPVLELKGELLQGDDPKSNHSDVKQIGKNIYLSLSGDIDDYVNHSCNPNCNLYIVGNRAFLYSLYVITAGSEITFDYSTSSTDNVGEWKMECQCGSSNCRKVISGFQYLDPDLQDDYKKRGIVPLFMRHAAFGGK